ncbi:MAG TPA: Ig-like domain-containing protein [Pyrinomonadaceae bacterium]|nr:Ig-like domain-containing protein [Pyrinomonadaceae bacterium]
MITGFNTDIEHDGVVYHVQTEDKGLDTPIILSLVYVGGAILASKRAPYQDLIAEGFNDEVLAERLKRQHRLICAAINSGRINDLKKMGARVAEEEAITTQTIQPPEELEMNLAQTVEAPPVPQSAAPVEDDLAQVQRTVPADEFDLELEPIPSQIWSPEKVEPPPPPPEPKVLEPPVEERPQDQAYADQDTQGYSQYAGTAPQDGITILLLDDAEFNSGDSRTLRVFVVDREGKKETPVGGIAVSIKILGTTFRPLIYSLKTDRDGVATVTTQIPQFTSGRAAVLVRVVAKDQAAELRRIIHPGS